jgi:pSer/pThr/pTyr-binding forkhead associated (FHA) protein
MIATVVLVLRLALTIALYIFLAWAMWTLWQELKQQGKNISGKKTAGISVVQKSEQGKNREYHFFQSEIIIGRHSLCDISVIDEVVSSQHARLSYHHNQWWLEDLSSTNGTFLNGSILNTPAVVITDDEIKCGNTQFVLRVEAEENLPEKK